jgi:hypothetical protein
MQSTFTKAISWSPLSIESMVSTLPSPAVTVKSGTSSHVTYSKGRGASEDQYSWFDRDIKIDACRITWNYLIIKVN